MGFNELNSVEHYIIHQLSGVNLNSKEVIEPINKGNSLAIPYDMDNFNDDCIKNVGLGLIIRN